MPPPQRNTRQTSMPTRDQRNANISASYQTDFTAAVCRRTLMLAADAAVAHLHPVTVSGPSLVSRPRSHLYHHHHQTNRFVFDHSKLTSTRALRSVQLCMFRYICIYAQCHKLHSGIVQSCKFSFSLTTANSCQCVPIRN